MKNFLLKSISIVPILLFIITVFLLVSPRTSAQQREAPTGAIRPSPTGGGVPEQPRQPSIRERQNTLREMELEAAKIRTPEEEKLALVEIAEDFEKMQLVNNKMMSSTMRAATPDYQRVAESTAEIKSRAVRIRENLRLAKPKEDEKRPSHKKADNAAQLKASLLSLDGTIMSFIKNPIFTNPAVVNLEQAAKASTDLETIIALSQFISKDAQRLGKSAGKE
jgi:hypothetical protein